MLSGEAPSSNFKVFGLTRPRLESTIYRTLTITPQMLSQVIRLIVFMYIYEYELIRWKEQNTTLSEQNTTLSEQNPISKSHKEANTGLLTFIGTSKTKWRVKLVIWALFSWEIYAYHQVSTILTIKDRSKRQIINYTSPGYVLKEDEVSSL